MIQPTVEGMQEVATKLSQGRVVAVPTECTYEVAVQLDWQEPNFWADRIRLLYSGQEAIYNTSSREASDNSATKARGDVCLRPGTAVSFTISDFSADSDSSFDNLQAVKASPNRSDGNAVPHIYVHQFALEGPFWRKFLPKRPYAVRSKEGEVFAAHAFNETQQLVRLLASKVWPGPVLIYVAIEQHLPGLTVKRHGKDYLALRSLCHPLMVKVYQEYLSSLQSQESESTPDDSMGSPAGDHLLSPNRRSPSLNPDSLLIGLALKQNAASYVTKATQVGPDLPVLNGEESQDIFAVPPCEYLKPCPDSLWLDASRRLLILSRNSDTSPAPHLTCQQLLQALQNQKSSKADKDRVIVAVLNKWKVVEEHDGHDPEET
jgi:hypothetical protein